MNKVGKTDMPRQIIHRRLLSAEAADVLRAKIIEGEFAQGFKLIEEDLSQMLGVSRACIREAVMQLENEGLVARGEGRSREVATFRKSDVREIYMLRLYIEKLAITECLNCGNLPLAALLRKGEQILRLVGKKPIDAVRLTEADLDFHEMLIAAAGSRAMQVWQGLKNQIKTLLLLYFRTAPNEPSPDDYANHDRIVEALQNGNKAQVEALLEAHILSGMDTLLRQ